jgi:EAL domain-containing protein (putative c-di-GMP-specific phosphodiesterase class I)
LSVRAVIRGDLRRSLNAKHSNQSFLPALSFRNDEIIVRSTSALGHNVALRVLFGGVEDAVMPDNLGALHRGFAQGYHLGRPLTVAAIEVRIARWTETAASAT